MAEGNCAAVRRLDARLPGALGTSAQAPDARGAGMRRALAAGGVAILAALLSACGGGQRQDATEPAGSFPVEVTKARFPTHQRLAQASDLELAVRNVGDKTVPNLAITIYTGEKSQTQKADGSFNVRVNPTAASPDDPTLANPNRPVWILEQNFPKLLQPGMSLRDLAKAPSAGAEAAQKDTFQFGPLAPGETKDMVWHVTAVREGTYTVHYEVAAGLEGKARAVTRDGGRVQGQFIVTISRKPPQTCVNAAGQVVQGRCQF